MPTLHPSGEYDSIRECPDDVDPADYRAAMDAKYHSSFNVVILPSKKVAIFYDNWRLHFIGTIEEAQHFFDNPPAKRPDQSPARPLRPAVISEGIDELLASLNLG
jgi:hypothetical protein